MPSLAAAAGVWVELHAGNLMDCMTFTPAVVTIQCDIAQPFEWVVPPFYSAAFTNRYGFQLVH